MQVANGNQKKILINIEPISTCFADCAMCPRDVIPKDGKMTPDTLGEILSRVSEDFVHEISFAGRGEPALHPNIGDFLKAARSTGIITSIVTTGISLNQKKAPAVIDNVDILRLSVSSYDPQAFKRVHRGLDYERVWKNFRNFAHIDPEKIVVHLTGGESIYSTLPQTVQFLRDHGVRHILLFPLWNRGGDIETRQDKEWRISLQRELGISPSESEYGGGADSEAFQGDWRRGLEENDRYCPVGDSSLSINYDGRIIGCFQDFAQGTVLGNVSEMNLKEVWQERKKILGKMPVCQKCEVNNVSVIQLHRK